VLAEDPGDYWFVKATGPRFTPVAYVVAGPPALAFTHLDEAEHVFVVATGIVTGPAHPISVHPPPSPSPSSPT